MLLTSLIIITYCFAAHSEIQEASVQYILDTVVTELLADERRRFIYVEIAFFYRWWEEQTEDRQKQVRTLVNEGKSPLPYMCNAAKI